VLTVHHLRVFGREEDHQRRATDTTREDGVCQVSDNVGALQGREALLTSCDGSIHQGTDLIECHTQTVRSRSDEALSDLSTLGADLRVVEDGLLDARDEVVFEKAVDGVCPAFDAVTDDIGFAFLR
jgi:hypothetical protein